MESFLICGTQEEVQNKIKSYLNPVVTRTFHDHLSSLRSQPAKDEQTHEDVLIFSEKNNTTQKNLYFKYLETHDALATAQIICDDIKKKSKIDISLFAYFEAARERKKFLVQGQHWFTHAENNWLELIQLFHRHPELLEDPTQSFEKFFDIGRCATRGTAADCSVFEMSCLFYATFGHCQTLGSLLSDHMLAGNKFSPRMYALLFEKAATYGHLDILKLLLQHNPTALSPVDIATALKSASKKGCLQAVDFLLNQQYNMLSLAEDFIEEIMDQQQTALRCAAFHGHTEIVQLLLHTLREETENAHGYALLDASINGHFDTVQCLLGFMADTAYISEKNAAFYHAVEKGHIEIAKLLLSRAANDIYRSTKEQTLQLAANNNDIKMVLTLIQLLRNQISLERLQRLLPEYIKEQALALASTQLNEYSAAIELLLNLWIPTQEREGKRPAEEQATPPQGCKMTRIEKKPETRSEETGPSKLRTFKKMEP